MNRGEFVWLAEKGVDRLTRVCLKICHFFIEWKVTEKNIKRTIQFKISKILWNVKLNGLVENVTYYISLVCTRINVLFINLILFFLGVLRRKLSRNLVGKQLLTFDFPINNSSDVPISKLTSKFAITVPKVNDNLGQSWGF